MSTNKIAVSYKMIATIAILLLCNSNAFTIIPTSPLIPLSQQFLLHKQQHGSFSDHLIKEREHYVLMPSSRKFSTTRLYASKSKDIQKMKASEMKAELESYGISTKSMFEKSEFAEALMKARAEGKTPMNDKKKKSTTSSSPSGGFGSKSNNKKSSGKKNKELSREDLIKEEMDKIKSMKLGDIRKELSERGISSKSFFEKSEFIKALAVARVDSPVPEEEEYDPSYRDVQMQKFAPMSIGPTKVIDVKLGK